MLMMVRSLAPRLALGALVMLRLKSLPDAGRIPGIGGPSL
jgi:hypothetical protein